MKVAICWSCATQRSLVFFCSGDVQVSLRVAACGFFSIGVFLALLSWDMSVGCLISLIDSASACFITKFFSFATVIMGESMSGFRCYLQSVHSVSVLRLFLESLCVCSIDGTLRV